MVAVVADRDVQMPVRTRRRRQEIGGMHRNALRFECLLHGGQAAGERRVIAPGALPEPAIPPVTPVRSIDIDADAHGLIATRISRRVTRAGRGQRSRASLRRAAGGYSATGRLRWSLWGT